MLLILCRPIRAISSDRGKVVSGSDDQSVMVWDKQTSKLLVDLKGHDAQVWSVICFWLRTLYVEIKLGFPSIFLR